MPKKHAGKAAQSHERQRSEVLLEAMRDDIKRVAEGHGSLERRFDTVDQRFDAVDRRIDDTQRALTSAVTALTAEIRALKQQIGALQQAVLELRAEVRTIGGHLDAHLQQAHAT